MDAAGAQARIVEALTEILGVIPVLALEAHGWQQEPATAAIVAAIYAFGGTRADVDRAMEQGRERLRYWLAVKDAG
jgi:hypothetical protein